MSGSGESWATDWVEDMLLFRTHGWRYASEAPNASLFTAVVTLLADYVSEPDAS